MYLNLFDERFYPELKGLIRRQMRLRKRALTVAERQASARAVFDRVAREGLLDGVCHLMLYHALPDELPTAVALERLADETGLSLYLPRVNGDDIEVVPYDSPDSLSDDNPFHILEPVGQAVDATILQAVIVPGVAFDRAGNRLGRGRGYYDRLLAGTDLLTIGVGFDCQLLDSLPCEPHDRCLDYVVTPSVTVGRGAYSSHIHD